MDYMTVYAVYTIYFLALLVSKKAVTKNFCFTERETKVLLAGLVIYCATHLISATLIRFGLKTESFQIVGHHAILLPLCVVLYVKMVRSNSE